MVSPGIKFSKKISIAYFSIFVLIVSFSGCSLKRETGVKPNDEMPPIIFWAWERPEDLRFIDTKKHGVAFLAQTLFLQADAVIFRPRRQPLEVSPETYLIAVTRIETDKQPEKRALLSERQREKIVDLIKKSLQLPNVKAVQIDFDAVVSERDFYRSLVIEFQKQLPASVPLTITALASWCVGKSWFGDLPIDEAVPMAFEMGADSASIRDFLAKENDWQEPLCRGSYGVSLNENLNARLKPNRRFFYFKYAAWDKSDLEKLNY